MTQTAQLGEYYLLRICTLVFLNERLLLLDFFTDTLIYRAFPEFKVLPYLMFSYSILYIVPWALSCLLILYVEVIREHECLHSDLNIHLRISFIQHSTHNFAQIPVIVATKQLAVISSAEGVKFPNEETTPSGSFNHSFEAT